MHLHIPSWIFPFIMKWFDKAYNSLSHRNLEKHVEPLRAAARAHPGRLEWRVEFGSQEYDLSEKLVREGLLLRSALFPNFYKLPTRYH